MMNYVEIPNLIIDMLLISKSFYKPFTFLFYKVRLMLVKSGKMKTNCQAENFSLTFQQFTSLN